MASVVAAGLVAQFLRNHLILGQVNVLLLVNNPRLVTSGTIGPGLINLIAKANQLLPATDYILVGTEMSILHWPEYTGVPLYASNGI